MQSRFHKSVSTAFLLVAASLSSTALAQSIRIEYWSAGAPAPLYSADFPNNAALTALPNIGPSVARINIYGIPENGVYPSLGAITLNQSSSSSLSSTSDLIIHLGQGEVTSSLPATIQNLGGIKANGALQTRTRLSGSIRGNATGTFQLGALDTFNIAGTCAATLDLNRANTAIQSLNVGRIAPLPGSSPSIRVRNGHIQAIISQNEIVVPAHLSISSKFGISAILATSIDANIFANAFAGQGDINVITASTGDIKGRIQCTNMRSPDGDMNTLVLSSAGALLSQIVVQNDLFGGISAFGIDPLTNNSITSIKVGRNMLGAIDGQGNLASVLISGSIKLDTNSFVAPIIRSRTGTIQSIVVEGNIEGDANNLALIQARDIGFFAVGGDCRAVVSEIFSGLPLNIKSITIGGSFSGTIAVNTFDKISIGGDLSPQSLLRLNTGLPANRSVSIGQSLQGVMVIGGNRSLNGNIILNAADTPTGSWAPGGELHVEREGRPPAIYTRSTFPADGSLFGSGSVGEVKFSLRPFDCLPRPNATVNSISRRVWPVDRSIREVLVLSMNGPVMTKSSLPPFIINAAGSANLTAEPEILFGDISSQFDFLVAPPGFPRQVWISPKTRPDGTRGSFPARTNFEITPTRIEGQTILRSSTPLLPGGASVSDFTYRLSVGGFDFNEDGKVSPVDAHEWIDAPSDLDGDLGITQVDLDILLEATLDLR